MVILFPLMDLTVAFPLHSSMERTLSSPKKIPIILLNFTGVYDLEAFASNRNIVHVDCRDMKGVDCCSGIPDSGTGMAMGYAAGKGVPYQRCIAKYTPTWPRSFTPSNQSMRSLVAKMKLIPNKAMLKGKRVLFCDDSIVRGTQLRDNVKVLFDQAGLKECHQKVH